MTHSDWEHNRSQIPEEDFGESLFDVLSDIEPTSVETVPESRLNVTHSDDSPAASHHETETSPTVVENLPSQKSRNGPAMIAILFGVTVIAAGYLLISQFGNFSVTDESISQRSEHSAPETIEDKKNADSPTTEVDEENTPNPKPFSPPPSPLPNREPFPLEPPPMPVEEPTAETEDGTKPDVKAEKDIEPKPAAQPKTPRPNSMQKSQSNTEPPPSSSDKPKPVESDAPKFVVRYRCAETQKKFYVDRAEMLKDAARLRKLGVGVYTAKTGVKQQIGTTVYYQTVYYMTYRLRAGGSADFDSRDEADACAAFLREFGFVVRQE